MRTQREIQIIKNEFTKNTIHQLLEAFRIEHTCEYEKNDYRELILMTFMAIYGDHWDNNIATDKSIEEITELRKKCLTASPNYNDFIFGKDDVDTKGRIYFGSDNYPELNRVLQIGKQDRESGDLEYTKLICQQIRNSIAHGNFYFLEDGTVQVWNDYIAPTGVTPDFRLRLDFMCIVDICLDLLGKKENIELEQFLKELMIKSDKESGNGEYAEFIEKITKKKEGISEEQPNDEPISIENDAGKNVFYRIFVAAFIAYNERYVCGHFYNMGRDSSGVVNYDDIQNETKRLFDVNNNSQAYISAGNNFLRHPMNSLFVHDVRNVAVHNINQNSQIRSNLLLEINGNDITITRRRYKPRRQQTSYTDKYEYRNITYSYEEVLKQMLYFAKEKLLTTQKESGELFDGDEISKDNQRIRAIIDSNSHSRALENTVMTSDPSDDTEDR